MRLDPAPVRVGAVLAMLEARRAEDRGRVRARPSARKAEADELKAAVRAGAARHRGPGAPAASRRRSPRASRWRPRSRPQAQAEARARLERAEDEIAREREKAKEMLKEQMIRLSMRSAEKILRQKLDDAVAAQAGRRVHRRGGSAAVKDTTVAARYAQGAVHRHREARRDRARARGPEGRCAR